MNILDKFGCIPYGGDYCPEQWDERVWQEDLRIMRHYGVNTVTINVHNWVLNQPAEGIYDYSSLDKIVKMVSDAGLRIIMGTGTTAVPNWMGKKYPDMILTDIHGIKHTTGTREVYCPNSHDYRREIKKAVEHLAEHYQHQENIVLWHMANEVGLVCYCPQCAQAYRKYLQHKFGSLEELNRAWSTSQWGHLYTAWEEIDPPMTATEYGENFNDTVGNNFHFRPTEAIEYLRFFSESLRECYELEAAAIRKYIPDAKVTNNFQFRTLDYRRVCEASSVIAYDSYPSRRDHPAKSAMNYDICRGLQTPGKPFMLMEMSPNQASWERVAALKRPGEVTRIALQGIAHGADSALYFQIRRSPSGFEKFHGAMIDHVGHEHTRIGAELTELGKKLQALYPYLRDTRIKAKAAVIMDFDNQFGVEIPCSIQKHIDYWGEVEHYYRYFNEHNIPVDVLPASGSLSGYSLVVAPMLYMLDQSFADEIKTFVHNGGIFVCTYYSGIVDLNDKVYPGGYPGVLRDVCGIWVEETDALDSTQKNIIRTEGALGDREFSCGFMCDIIHLQGATSLGNYTCDFYAGTPCVCENQYGAGRTVYLGSKLDSSGVDAVLDYCCGLAGVSGILSPVAGVEACLRESNDTRLLFLLSNAMEPKELSLPQGEWATVIGTAPNGKKITLMPGECAVLRSV